MQVFRLTCLICILSLVLGLALTGCSTTAAKVSWTAADQEQMLTAKVKNSRNAYLRYSQAEEDARKDGFPEAVAQYSQAKASAQKEFEDAERELAAFKAAKSVKVSTTTP